MSGDRNNALLHMYCKGRRNRECVSVVLHVQNHADGSEAVETANPSQIALHIENAVVLEEVSVDLG